MFESFKQVKPEEKEAEINPKEREALARIDQLEQDLNIGSGSDRINFWVRGLKRTALVGVISLVALGCDARHQETTGDFSSGGDVVTNSSGEIIDTRSEFQKGLAEERQKRHMIERDKQNQMTEKIKELAKSKNIKLDESNNQIEYQINEHVIDTLKINGVVIDLSPEDKQFLGEAHHEIYFDGSDLSPDSPEQGRNLEGNKTLGAPDWFNPDDF